MRRNFRSEGPIKVKKCGNCGADSILRKRRNFPFGKKSGARTTMRYVCSSCKATNYKSQEVK
jgi:ribosomal protein S27AE